MKHASAESLIAVTGKNVTFFRSYLSSLSAPPMQLAFSGSNSRSYLSVLDFSCPTPRGQRCPRIPALPSYMAANSDRMYVEMKTGCCLSFS